MTEDVMIRSVMENEIVVTLMRLWKSDNDSKHNLKTSGFQKMC